MLAYNHSSNALNPSHSLSYISLSSDTSCLVFSTSISQSILDLWYRRLAHASMPTIKKALVQSNIPFYSNSINNILCSAYEMNKSHKLSFQPKVSNAILYLQAIHSDV